MSSLLSAITTKPLNAESFPQVFDQLVNRLDIYIAETKEQDIDPFFLKLIIGSMHFHTTPKNESIDLKLSELSDATEMFLLQKKDAYYLVDRSVYKEFYRCFAYAMKYMPKMGQYYEAPTWTTYAEDKDWDDWEKAVRPEVTAYYEGFCHPTIIRRAIMHLPQNAVIVEICGGSGKMAKQLLDTAAKAEKTIASYIFIERNAKLLQEAQVLLSLNPKVKTIPLDLSLHSIPLEKESVDIAIGSGALSHVVLKNRFIALNILDDLTTVLKVHGLLILGEYMDSFLCSRDFEERGLKSISYDHFPYYSQGSSVYVLEKIIIPKQSQKSAKGRD